MLVPPFAKELAVHGSRTPGSGQEEAHAAGRDGLQPVPGELQD